MKPMCLTITMDQVNEAALGFLEDEAVLAHLKTCPLCKIELDWALEDLAGFEEAFREADRRDNYRMN